MWRNYAHSAQGYRLLTEGRVTLKQKITEFIKGVTLALLYIMIFLGMQAALSVIASGIAYEAGYDPKDSIANTTGAVSIFSGVISVCIFMGINYLRGIKLNDRIKRKKLSFSDVVCTFVLAIGLRILTSAYMLWAESIPVLKKSIDSAQEAFNADGTTVLGTLLLLVAVGLVAPVFEEILFRCMVQHELKEAGGVAFAVIVQGIMFGVAHANAVQTLFTIVIGIILGIIYHRTKNVTMTILVHLFFNCSVSLTLKDMSMLWYSTAIGAVMSLSAIILIFVLHKKEKVEMI